jgi:hypothetical protein
VKFARALPALFALCATALVWGPGLSSKFTFSAEATAGSVTPFCRVGGPQLSCIAPRNGLPYYDSGATSWQEIPASYFYREARREGLARPSWNPYIGSGFPSVFDGIHTPASPVQWFTSHVPGDAGRDMVVFGRFTARSAGVAYAAAMMGAGPAVVALVALAATLSPFQSNTIDIVYHDVDLLGPWFLVLLLGFVQGRVRLRTAALLGGAFGLVVGALGFLQAQFTMACVIALLCLAAAPATRGRSLWVGLAAGAGLLAFVPTFVPLLGNLKNFAHSRSVQCIADRGIGWGEFTRVFFHPQLGGESKVHDLWTAAGVVMMAATFWRWRPRWIAGALLATTAWLVFGLPSLVCAVPGITGVRFVRDLVPHAEMLFLVSMAASAAAVAHVVRDAPRPWTDWRAVVPIAGAIVPAVVLAAMARPPWSGALTGFAIAGVVLVAAGVAVRRIPAGLRWAAVGAGLALVALPPHAMTNGYLHRRWQNSLPPQVPPLPDRIDPSSPLGAVRDLSRREDRRHFSPHDILVPNWPQALGVLDLRILYPFYPQGYHELNAALFDDWEWDPQHVLKPDRFTRPLHYENTFSPGFQRILVLHRVSLLSFAPGRGFFPMDGGPYQMGNCRLLARGNATESYFCPEMGAVGHFPTRVQIVGSRPEALAIIKATAPTDLLGIALVGPELDDGPRDGLVPAVGKVVDFHRELDTLGYTLDVEQPGVFVIADAWFPGWSATIDGKPAPILRANVAFKAVRVPAGRVKLELRFDPTWG